MMTQQLRSQHCLRNRHRLQWYQSRATHNSPQNVYTAKAALISLRLVLKADGWMTWQGGNVRIRIHVKSRLALMSQISTFRSQLLPAVVATGAGLCRPAEAVVICFLVTQSTGVALLWPLVRAASGVQNPDVSVRALLL